MILKSPNIISPPSAMMAHPGWTMHPFPKYTFPYISLVEQTSEAPSLLGIYALIYNYNYLIFK